MVFHKSYRDGVLRLKDGGSENAVISVSEGTLSIKWVSEKSETMARGSIHEVKKGDEGPAEVSFSYLLEGFGTLGDTPAADTAYEIVTNTMDGANWVTTRASTNVFCVDLRFELLNKAGAVEETIDLSDFYYTGIDVAEGDPSKITITGKAFDVLPTIS